MLVESVEQRSFVSFIELVMKKERIRSKRKIIELKENPL